MDDRSPSNPRPVMCRLLGFIASALLAGCQSSGPPPLPPEAAHGDVAANTRQARADTDRAFDLIGHGDYPAATPLLERALAADPLYGPAHNDLGLVYFHQDRPYDAAWEFQRAATLMPRRGEPHNNLGLVYERADKWPEAEAAYQAALDLDPINTDFAGNLARTRIRRGERDADTQRLLELVIMKDPRSAWVEWARSQLHRAFASTLPATMP